MPRLRYFWLLTLLLSGFVGFLGCSKPAPVGPTKLRGTVYFQNRPLTGGLIVFSPDPEKGNTGKAYQATINQDGEYLINLEASQFTTSGWYRVALADPPGLFTPEQGYPDFPKALRRPDRSGLTREVLANRDNEFHFHVEVHE